jgi:hypothetical protein
MGLSWPTKCKRELKHIWLTLTKPRPENPVPDGFAGNFIGTVFNVARYRPEKKGGEHIAHQDVICFCKKSVTFQEMEEIK